MFEIEILSDILITNSMDMSLSKLQGMVKDREAWRASIYGVAKSRTQLSNWTITFLSLSVFVTFGGLWRERGHSVQYAGS